MPQSNCLLQRGVIIRQLNVITLITTLTLLSASCSSAAPSTPDLCKKEQSQASTKGATTKAEHEGYLAGRNDYRRVGQRVRHSFAGADLPVRQQPVNTPVDIILPSTLYLIRGHTYQLYFSKFIQNFDPALYTVNVDPIPGDGHFEDHWEFTPQHTGSFTMSLTVSDRHGNAVATATRPILAKSDNKLDRLRTLAIGDSLTRPGLFANYATHCILGGTTVGTRTYDSGTINTEGRGGWDAAAFISRIGDPKGDSPFVFPKGIEGQHFRGNTSFWKNVTHDNPDGYDYNGFQRIAREWNDSGEFDFLPSGYPKLPRKGDVVIDPSQAGDNKWMQFDGTEWQLTHTKLDTEVSFEKYIDRYSFAFSSGAPSIISILLGTNDFMKGLNEQGWQSYRASLDNLVSSIHRWKPDIPVVLIGPPNGGPEQMWNGKGTTRTEFDARMMELSRRLYAAFDNPTSRQNKIYVMSFLGVLSDSDMADWVHPEAAKQPKLGLWLAGLLAHLRDQALV